MPAEPDFFQLRWVWLGGSLLLGVLASWLNHVLHRLPQPWAKAWLEWRGRPWVEQGLRFLYAVGIPAAALLWQGALTPRGLGLQPVSWTEHASPEGVWQAWARDIGNALLLASAALGVYGLAQAQARRLTGNALPREHDPSIALREAVYHQAHWAFYREPFVLLWGPGVGTWIGLLPVLLEALLNPARWADLRVPERSHALLTRALLAIVGALLFATTQNLWLGLSVDLLLGWIWGQTPETGTPRREGAALRAATPR